MFKILGRNCCPEYILNKITNNYRNEKFRRNGKKIREKGVNSSYFKLPDIGKLSTTFKIQLHKMSQKYCKDVNAGLVFQSCKLDNVFSTKDKLTLKSMVVYRFACARCNSCYIKYTNRHLSTRINGYIKDSQSHIYKHLQESLECNKNF